MALRRSSSTIGVSATLLVASIGLVAAAGQSQPKAGRDRNLKVLGNIPPGRLSSIMNAWNQALGVRCRHCHPGSTFEGDNPVKERAREMQRMVQAINRTTFTRPGVGQVTCYTCHQGRRLPATNPGEAHAN